MQRRTENDNNKNIGILGGSFDPIHFGHIRIAGHALVQANLDLVLFMVAPRPPHKDASQLSPFEHRLKMTRLALKDKEGMEASDLEEKIEGRSYTIYTIEKLRTLYPQSDFSLIVGSDTISDIPNWYKPEELLNLVNIIPFLRLPETEINFSILRNLVGREKLHQIERSVINIKPIDISSTEIRHQIKNNQPISNLTPTVVENYIKTNNLYKD